jgi:hypothetical protein
MKLKISRAKLASGELASFQKYLEWAICPFSCGLIVYMLNNAFYYYKKLNGARSFSTRYKKSKKNIKLLMNGRISPFIKG